MAFLKQLYNGTSTIDFSAVWNSSKSPGYYLIDNTWTPTIPSRQPGAMGGRQLYEYQRETFQFAIVGSDDDDVYAKLHNLTAMFDQARRWWDSGGGGVSPVLYKIRPHGSTRTNPLQAAVWETAEHKAQISLPPHIESIEGSSHLTPISISFTHQILLGAEESAVNSASIENGALAAFSFSDTKIIPAPFDLRISYDLSMTDSNVPEEFIIVAPADKLHLLSAHQIASGKFTSVADSAHHAYEDYVLRYTPTDTNVFRSNTIALSGLSIAGTISCYVKFRPNTGTTKFSLQVFISDFYLSSNVTTIKTDPYLISPNNNVPEIAMVGQLHAPFELSSSAKIFVSVSADDASGTLDIDEIVLVGDGEDSKVIRSSSRNLFYSLGTVDISTYESRFINATKTTVFPYAAYYTKSTITTATNADLSLSYEGDIFFRALSSNMAAVVFSLDPNNISYWRWYTGSAIQKHTFTAIRRPAYLVPQ